MKHSSTIPGLPGVRNYLTTQFKTSFERKPVATEEMMMAKMGCCWEILEYKVEWLRG